jgi:hypothetical protein
MKERSDPFLWACSEAVSCERDRRAASGLPSSPRRGPGEAMPPTTTSPPSGDSQVSAVCHWMRKPLRPPQPRGLAAHYCDQAGLAALAGDIRGQCPGPG